MMISPWCNWLIFYLTALTPSLPKDDICSVESAQKIVARSSTESELIGVHDVLPQVLWSARFLKAQGYKVQTNILYQDNMSSMRLEKNG